MIAYDDVEGAPRTALSHAGRELTGYRVEGIIYAPSFEAARARLQAADIYLDHARVLDDYDGAPVRGGVSDPAETSGPGREAHLMIWQGAGHDEEPRDQEADTDLFEHGYWSLGPEHDGSWSVTLIEHDENLGIISEQSWHAATEEDCKRIAAHIESNPPHRMTGGA